MTKFKRIGIIFIIAGIFIPSFFYPFTTLKGDAAIVTGVYASRGVAYSPRLSDLEICFDKGRWVQDTEGRRGHWEDHTPVPFKSEWQRGHWEDHTAVPYNFILALGIALVFLGISFIILTGKMKEKEL